MHSLKILAVIGTSLTPFSLFPTLRRDYIFSYIKKLRAHDDRVTPERKHLTMETPFMEAYVKLLINTCHRRGAHAMGGMAAQIPVRICTSTSSRETTLVHARQSPGISRPYLRYRPVRSNFCKFVLVLR